jgi:sugar/nucleoside kinase (ribokinase family)
VLPGIDGEPTTAILKKAKEMGKVTSLDTVWDAKGRWMSLIKTNLPYIDYLLPSLEEAKMLTGKNRHEDIARTFLDLGAKTVGLKMGEEGCYIRSQDEEHHIPIYRVEVIDATGAGDAYVAGFLLGVLRGWDLEKIGRMANAVGACCVTAMGASAGIKSYEETVKMIEP